MRTQLAHLAPAVRLEPLGPRRTPQYSSLRTHVSPRSVVTDMEAGRLSCT